MTCDAVADIGLLRDAEKTSALGALFKAYSTIYVADFVDAPVCGGDYQFIISLQKNNMDVRLMSVGKVESEWRDTVFIYQMNERTITYREAASIVLAESMELVIVTNDLKVCSAAGEVGVGCQNLAFVVSSLIGRRSCIGTPLLKTDEGCKILTKIREKFSYLPDESFVCPDFSGEGLSESGVVCEERVEYN